MTCDPIAGALSIALVVLGIIVSLRGYRQHLWWILPFALSCTLCIPWSVGVPQATSSSQFTIEMTPVIPGTLVFVPIFTLYGAAMLVLTIKYHMKRRIDSQPVVLADDVWPPAPWEGEK